MGIDYKRLFHQLILALSRTLDIDEARKLNHGQRAAVLSYYLAQHLCPASLSTVYYSALLHDIGGIGLFDHIVHHPSPVEQAANPAIRVHPIVGAQIIGSIPNLEPCVPVILNHHERYDGHGYPGGKSREKISLEAQIVRAADAFDLFIRHTDNMNRDNILKAFEYKSGREISPALSEHTCGLICDDGIFSIISDDLAVNTKVKELNRELAGFELPWGMDVIGTLLEVFAQVIDTKHTYTAGHSQRVSKYSVHIGLAMELAHDDITKLKWSALIHDVGKVAVPRSILEGTTGLNAQELAIIRQHPKYTLEVLSCVDELQDLAHFGAYHHERWDGRGYPEGLKGEEIPLPSRIICIADAFDSLTSDRVYHKAIGTREALCKLSADGGAQFDPQVFDVAKQVLWSGVV
ncbi:MAG: HD domain-containing protein [Candidatus Schekmanbacteria bacterium]|nr:HD domain-containing protein [Candidatus Schekmanbacteria bacterium]